MTDQRTKDEAASARRFTTNDELRAFKAHERELRAAKDAAASAMLGALKAEMDLLSLHRSVQHMNHLRSIIAQAEAAGIKVEG